MSKQPLDDEILVNSARQLLDQSVDNIDEQTLEQLATIRGHALATGNRKRTGVAPAAMAASLVLSIAIGTVWRTQYVASIEVDQALEDIAMLSTHDGPGFYEEIDFYLWLEGTEQRG